MASRPYPTSAPCIPYYTEIILAGHKRNEKVRRMFFAQFLSHLIRKTISAPAILASFMVQTVARTWIQKDPLTRKLRRISRRTRRMKTLLREPVKRIL